MAIKRRLAGTARPRAASGTGFESAPGIALLLSCLLTAIVAHTSAGGVAPGPAGLTVTVLLLSPLAAAVNRLAQGPTALACVGLLGQLVAHVSMSLVTPSHAMHGGAGMPGMTDMMDAPARAGAHGTGGPAAHEAMSALAGSGAGDSAMGGQHAPGGHGAGALLGMAAGHILHMGAPMAAAHVVAAVLTAVLVSLALVGLRRAVSRVHRVFLRLWSPRTPLARSVAGRRTLVVPARPYLVVLGGRAPPAFS